MSKCVTCGADIPTPSDVTNVTMRIVPSEQPEPTPMPGAGKWMDENTVTMTCGPFCSMKCLP